MHLIKYFSLLFTCFLMSVTLSGCGSKGDLYQAVEVKPEQGTFAKESQPKNIDTIKKSN